MQSLLTRVRPTPTQQGRINSTSSPTSIQVPPQMLTDLFLTNMCLCKCSLTRACTHVHTHRKNVLPQTEVFGTTFFFPFCHFPKINALHGRQAAGRKGRKGNTQLFNMPSPLQSSVVSTGTVVRGFLTPHRSYGNFGSSRICYKPQT